MTVLTKEQVIEKVKDILRDMCLSEEGGYFTSEIYVDYRDEMSDETIKDIMEAEHPEEAFYDIMQEWEVDAYDYEFDALYREIRNRWDDETDGDFFDYKDDISDFLSEFVFFNLPYDHFLKQEVKVNIIVDNGDGNYDFTLNNLLNSEFKEEGIPNESSLLWLVKQQGYSRQDLEKALYTDEKINSKFLESVYNEVYNTTSYMNALTFFVKMTLEELIEYKENKMDIVLSKNTSCGLYDAWNGAGSMLEIELEKDVVIPAELADPDLEGCRGYGINDIYGMGNDFWTDTVIGFKLK